MAEKWKPSAGEEYWCPVKIHNFKAAAKMTWMNNFMDYCWYENGQCFKTSDEAMEFWEEAEND